MYYAIEIKTIHDFVKPMNTKSQMIQMLKNNEIYSMYVYYYDFHFQDEIVRIEINKWKITRVWLHQRNIVCHNQS